uniref:CCHC-type domain-containing protein n=1 Tax=Plectus sambesii TaxID=2011161 RepID=A0A914XFH5_9BILA
MTLPLPALPQFDGDEEAFPSWLAQFSAVLQYTKTEKSEEKCSLLLMCISQRVVRTLILGCNQKNVATEVDFDELMLQLTLNYRTTPIQLTEYNRLFSLRQQPGQSAREFASQIGHVAGYCQFPIDLKRVQAIVFSVGFRDDNIRSQLIQRDHKSMEPALQLARQLESIKVETTRSGNYPANSTKLEGIKRIDGNGATTTSPQCYRCERTNHTAANCRFKEEYCRNCDKKGHIAAVCRSMPNQQPSQQERRQPLGEKRDYQQQHRSHQISMDCVKIGKTAAKTTTGQVADSKTYQALIKVNGYVMLLEFDTSAAATVISEADWDLMGKPPLSTTRLPLKDFSGNRLKLKGQATVDVEYKGKRAKLPMIVGSQRGSVIRRKWIRQLEMCNCSLNVAKTTLTPQKKPSEDRGSQPIHAFLEELSLMFKEGLGHCACAKAHLEPKPNVYPRLIKTRKKMKLHFHKYERAKEKDELTVGADVLARLYQNQHKWVSGQVIGRKGKVLWLIKISGYDKPWIRHSNQLRLDRGSSNDSSRSISTGSAFRRVNDDTRDSVNFPTDLLDAVAEDDGTEDSDRPRSTNDADDVTAHPKDMLYTSPPDSPTRPPPESPSRAPPRAPELPPSVTAEGPPPLRRSTRES